jgi:hypothetical protein
VSSSNKGGGLVTGRVSCSPKTFPQGSPFIIVERSELSNHDCHMLDGEELPPSIKMARTARPKGLLIRVSLSRLVG